LGASALGLDEINADKSVSTQWPGASVAAPPKLRASLRRTFVRVRLSGERETPLHRVERRFRQDRDDMIQKAAQAYTKMMAGKPRFRMVVTMD
jgi:hypothetical protein